MLPHNTDIGTKRKRVTRACDKCHRNGSKCSRTPGGDRCVRCVELGIPCTFDRPVKRRGPPARRARLEENEPSISRAASLRIPPTPGEGTSTSSAGSPPPPRPDAASASFWSYDDLLDRQTVEGLADIYHRTMYPLRPFIHWPSMAADIRAGRYRSNWGVFLVTVAMCAMAAGKLADGGVPGHVPAALQARASTLAAECYGMAVAALHREPDDDVPVDVLSHLKARIMLGCTSMQRGNRIAALAHYGAYSVLSSQSGFHEEANWPPDLTEIQRQERRRLFWYGYQADYYTSTTLGLAPRHCEARARVKYPAEVDDDDLSESGLSPRLGHVSFMRGWNVCTDLYRIIEHVYDNMRADPTSEEDDGSVTAFLSHANKIDSHAARKLLTRLVDDLPPELRRVKRMTGNIEVDRLGFIATNIIITGQTLKMMLALCDGSSMHQRCAIASELLDELATLPTAYLQASSQTALQHLAHVGHLLGGVNDGPLPAWTYLQVRNILLVLSEFIGTLESARSTPWDLAAKLREQIQRIDNNMIQADAAALPGLGDSLMMPSLDGGTDMEVLTEPAPPPPAPRTVPTMPVPNRMIQIDAGPRPAPVNPVISIDAGIGSQPPPLPPYSGPPASTVAEESMANNLLSALGGGDEHPPPNDALSALQIGGQGGDTSSSFSPLGFAAAQGMFDYGGAPMDDALIGEFFRFWPAQGMMADVVEGSLYTSPGM